MPPPRKLTEDEERIRAYIVAMLTAAEKGEVDWLPALLQEHGYTRLDPGLQQKTVVSEIGIPRKTLREWESDGLKFTRVKRAKYYPVLDLIRFMADRLAGRNNNKLDEIRERASGLRADLMEMEKLEKLGNLIDRREAEAQMIQLLLETRAALMSLPGALAARLEHQPAPVIRSTLKAELTWLCNEMQSANVPLPEAVVEQVDALIEAATSAAAD